VDLRAAPRRAQQPAPSRAADASPRAQVASRSEYDKTISETEAAYLKARAGCGSSARHAASRARALACACGAVR
jgi:hypothetical protein